MLTHGSFPHKTETLEFSISIPKLWWLPLLQSGTHPSLSSVEEPATERVPKFVVRTEVAATSDFRFDARTDAELMEKTHTVPDFIKYNTNHLEDCS